jgi:type IV fimbrial biogenesis protein FimT
METRGDTLSSKGFTLVELIITVAIAAIILGIAVPSFQVFTANNRVTSANNSIVQGLNLARFTAVTSNEDIAICGSTDTSTCSDWNTGWLVYNDADDATIRALTHTDDATMLDVTVQGGTSIVFRPDGTTRSFQPNGTVRSNEPLYITIQYHDTAVTSRCSKIEVDPFGSISSCRSKLGDSSGCC